MTKRPFWIRRIQAAWKEAPIVWLSGVRQCGKTTLARQLEPLRLLHLNCDLPQVAEMLKDPELFYRNCRHEGVILDEIHQLQDPSRILKIGADLFPKLKILATGSSTLAASRKFSDTLTGRKRAVHLLPVLWNELAAFENTSLPKRLFHGGLPAALLNHEKRPGFYREWLDSFFARDIQRLFAFRDLDKFNALFEYLMKQSGGLLEITRTAAALEISRPTVESHLRALETTHAVTLLRPFFGGGQKELVKMPKCYGFDTGFVSFCRGWDPPRPDELGFLWEHLVLEFLQAIFSNQRIQYWRDASGNEIDFVIPRSRDRVDVIECKWNPREFDPAAFKLFRSYYPCGNNHLITPSGGPAYGKRFGAIQVHISQPNGLKGEV